MSHLELAEETFDSAEALKEFNQEHVELRDYVIESAAWNALSIALQNRRLDKAEQVVRKHGDRVRSLMAKKPLRLSRKLSRKAKEFERELIEEYEACA